MSSVQTVKLTSQDYSSSPWPHTVTMTTQLWAPNKLLLSAFYTGRANSHLHSPKKSQSYIDKNRTVRVQMCAHLLNTHRFRVPLEPLELFRRLIKKTYCAISCFFFCFSIQFNTMSLIRVKPVKDFVCKLTWDDSVFILYTECVLCRL